MIMWSSCVERVGFASLSLGQMVGSCYRDLRLNEHIHMYIVMHIINALPHKFFLCRCGYVVRDSKNVYRNRTWSMGLSTLYALKYRLIFHTENLMAQKVWQMWLIMVFRLNCQHIAYRFPAIANILAKTAVLSSVRFLCELLYKRTESNGNESHFNV